MTHHTSATRTETDAMGPIEAPAARGRRVRWWGLELDPEPHALPLAAPPARPSPAWPRVSRTRWAIP